MDLPHGNGDRDVSHALFRLCSLACFLDKLIDVGKINSCISEIKAYREVRRYRGRVPTLFDVCTTLRRVSIHINGMDWQLNRHCIYTCVAEDNLFGRMQEMRVDANAFALYSDTKFKHHPYHCHKSILLGVAGRLEYLLEVAHNLLKPFPSPMSEEESLFFQKDIANLIDFVENLLAPNLFNIARTIRSTITVLQNGFYSKTHSSDLALAYRKGTSERGNVINEMVKNKCVPSKRALYEVINLRENGLFFTEEEWNTTRGGKPNQNVLLRARREYNNKEFEGQFMMALIPVPLRNKKSLITVQFFAPPKELEVCNYIGRIADGIADGRTADKRIYFSPKQFPTPVDLNEAGNNSTFQLLKTYIEYASEKGGSPVVCRYGKQGSKRFVCKHSKDCKYFFLVKWDMYGYYIHLYNDKLKQDVGDKYHNHSRISACSYIKFDCEHCGEAFHRLSDAIEHEDKYLCSRPIKKLKAPKF